MKCEACGLSKEDIEQLLKSVWENSDRATAAKLQIAIKAFNLLLMTSWAPAREIAKKALKEIS